MLVVKAKDRPPMANPKDDLIRQSEIDALLSQTATMSETDLKRLMFFASFPSVSKAVFTSVVRAVLLWGDQFRKVQKKRWVKLRKNSEAFAEATVEVKNSVLPTAWIIFFSGTLAVRINHRQNRYRQVTKGSFSEVHFHETLFSLHLSYTTLAILWISRGNFE